MKPNPNSLRALSRVNFALADVRDGLGPFLGIYLVALGWAPDEIGFVMTIGGLAGLVATTPAGWLVDATRFKRLLLAACALIVILVNGALLVSPVAWVVGLSQVATGLAAAAIGPAIMGLTLGLVGQDALSDQLGKNEAFNHAGNATAAILAGILGSFVGVEAVFGLMLLMGVLTLVFLFQIQPRDIDHRVARGLDDDNASSAGFLDVLKANPSIGVIAVVLALFHLGNAAMLPLLGQQVATAESMNATVYTSATVVIAQMTMIPMALWSARIAKSRGYWLLFVIGLAVLPLRGIIAGMTADLWAVFPIQILDGVAAGILGVATPGIVASVLRGTGRVNIGLGAVMTFQGIGASLSPLMGGILADQFGYDRAFLLLGLCGATALVVWLLFYKQGSRS